MHSYLKLLITLVVLVTNGCAMSRLNTTLVIDPELESLFELYLFEKQLRDGLDPSLDLPAVLELSFGPSFSGKHIGICAESGYAALIYIDRERWKNWSSEALVFHELAHCIQKRGHNTEVDEEGNPVSIMYPIVLNKQLYQDNREKYLDELFKEDGA